MVVLKDWGCDCGGDCGGDCYGFIVIVVIVVIVLPLPPPSPPPSPPPPHHHHSLFYQYSATLQFSSSAASIDLISSNFLGVNGNLYQNANARSDECVVGFANCSPQSPYKYS